MCLATLSPVAIPIGAVRASFAVLATGDLLQAVGDAAGSLHVQHLPAIRQVLCQGRFAALYDEVLDEVSYLAKHGKILMLQCVNNGFGYQECLLCNCHL